MEIHEPFSDLEKQISDMLDQLNKQEPLSTAACKQVVASLEKIKEYQINPSPKSKKEKMPTMDVKIDDLIRGFHETADDSKQQLQSILALISEGRVPDAPAMSQINATVDKLREQYTDVCQAAAHSIPAEEMPQEGSPADAYVEAVKNSKFLEYRKQLDEMRKTLEKFVSVQSLAEMYATALAPYQKEAQELMQSINALSPVQKEDVAAFEEKTAGPAAFLKALACSDYDTDEGWELLDAVPAYYSRKVYTGLSRNQYFLPESTKAIPAPKDPAPVAVPIANAVETEEAIKAAASDMSTPEAVAEAAAPKTEVISPEKDADDSEAERWHKLGIDNPAELLCAVDNSPLVPETSAKATSDFSTKKFENEITRNRQTKANKDALVTVHDVGCVDSVVLTKAFPDKQTDFPGICSSLQKLGYLQQYIIPDYPAFYTLSERGEKIFTTQKSAEFLGEKKSDRNSLPWTPNDTFGALTRILLLHSFSLAAKINPSLRILMAKPSLFNHFFCNFARYYSSDTSYTFIGITSNSVVDFEELSHFFFDGDITDIFADDTAVIIIGLNLTIAHSTALYFDSKLHEELQKTALYYYDYETKTCYRYTDDSVVELSELAESTQNHTEDPSTKQTDVKTQEKSIPNTVEPKASQTESPVCKPIAERTQERGSSEALMDELLKDMTAPKKEILEAPKEKVEDSFEDSAEADVQPEEPIKKVQNDPQQEEHMNNLREMLAKEQIYCATAYFNALSIKFPLYKPAYEQLAYAVNDPANYCSYNSEKIYSVYFNDSTVPDEHFAVAAAIRNVFYDYRGYDYALPSLHTALEGNSVLNENTALKNVLYILKEFKLKHHRGVDCFADYHQKTQYEYEAKLRSIRQEAASYYNNYILGEVKEKATMRRFIEAKKLAFRADGFLGESLKIIMDGDSSLNEYILDGLKESYIQEGDTICRENVNESKIDSVVDGFWEQAEHYVGQKKRTTDLVGSLRTNLTKQIRKVVDILAEYVNLTSSFVPEESDEAAIAYHRIRNGLLQGMNDALQECAIDPDVVGSVVLRLTLSEMISRLEGSYIVGSNRFFYQDFLRSNWILLDESTWLPNLEEIPIVENFSILDRIVEHSRETLPDFETRLQNILNGEDDYGSGRMILQLLENTHPELDLTQFDLEGSMEYAERQITIQRKNFLGELALAQSEGQITDDDQKEAYAAVTSDWYHRAESDNNYGFFRRIMEAIRTSIEKEAASRASDLNQNLDAYLKENPDWESSENIRTAVQRFRQDIVAQNYAAAEDQLNRLKSNDLSAYTDSGTDELERFLAEYNMHLSRLTNKEKTLQYQLAPYYKTHNKEGRGATRLLEFWPKGRPVNLNSIQQSMESLGFHVDHVDTIGNGSTLRSTTDMFTVYLKHTINEVPVNYTHPIYVFGSQAETHGFQVVCLFGKFDASTLMEKIDSIGSTNNTLILLDYSLTLQERRKLARLSKKKGLNGKTVAVIDRVVISYLAQHYSETSVNRMLMSLIIPFAACQPYVPDSSKPMPQEIFIGRHNELEKIKSPNGPNIVYGGRQLGKSALLKKAQKDIDHDRNGNRAVLVDIKDLDYQAAARKISEFLSDEGILTDADITENWSELSRSIRNRLRSQENRIPYLLLLLDEADAFLESCEAVNYKPFDALKEIQSMEADRFKFVVAGLRNVVRFNRKALDNNSVLPHMSSLTVKPFNSVEATELLEMPLRYLGFRFDQNDETQRLIATILNTTNYFPGMLQLYGAKLIEAMQYDYAGYDESETPPYRVSRDHIKKTLADDTLRDQIRDKFDITLHVGQDNYYYIIALLGAYRYYCYKNRSFSAQDIHDDACDCGISKLESLSVDSIHALMEEMRELNVLQVVTADHYRFTRENFRVMMGSEDKVIDEIDKVSKE